MSDPVRELKRELLAAAERQHGRAAVHGGRGRLGPNLGRNRLLLALTTLAIATAALLFATTPWSSSPGLLEKAQAALAPQAGKIRHEKWVVTSTSPEFGCTVRHHPSEFWMDETRPHRYRVVDNVLPPPKVENGGRRALACWNGTGPELGGSVDTGETWEFVPPKTLLRGAIAPGLAPQFGLPLDPVAELRQSLKAGTAHDEGKTTFNGRTVERIRIDPEQPCGVPGCPQQPWYWYVDPQSFHPVGMEGGGGISIPYRPFVRLHVVVRILAFEYLPRTPANLALTDIRAQHPNATRP
jgi:hypothetical protein